MKQTPTRILGLVVGAGLLVVSPALSSAAATRVGAAPEPLANVGTVTPNTSLSYAAGYIATSAGLDTNAVVKEFTVPAVDCTSSHFQGIAVGAGSEPAQGFPEYLSVVFVECVGKDNPLYVLDSLAGMVDNSDSNVGPGDKIQVDITVDCHPFPTCDVSSGVFDVTTSAQTQSNATATLSSKSTLYGAFPLFGGSGDLAKVPAFGSVRLKECIFNGAPLAGAQKINRKSGRTVEITPGKLKNGSFTLTYHNH